MAERLGRGLQNLVERFDSARCLHNFKLLCHLAVFYLTINYQRYTINAKVSRTVATNIKPICRGKSGHHFGFARN